LTFFFYPNAPDAFLMVQLLKRFDRIGQKLDEHMQLIEAHHKHFDERIDIKEKKLEVVVDQVGSKTVKIVDLFHKQQGIFKYLGGNYEALLRQTQIDVIVATDKIVKAKVDVKTLLQKDLPGDEREQASKSKRGGGGMIIMCLRIWRMFMHLMRLDLMWLYVINSRNFLR
jgi:hypothetical protein